MKLTDTQPSNHIEVKAQHLAKVLAKHNPVEIRELASKLLLRSKKGSDEFKVFAAAMEVMDALK